MKAIVGGKLLLESAEGGFCVREDAALLFDERIRKIVPREGLRYAADLEIIDAAGLYVSPGFLNLHVHGCGGADTMDEAAGSLIEMSRWQARMGVVAFLPTTMTYDFSRLDMAFGLKRSDPWQCRSVILSRGRSTVPLRLRFPTSLRRGRSSERGPRACGKQER